MLVEIALLPSGYSHAELTPDDPLNAVAVRYRVGSKQAKRCKEAARRKPLRHDV